MDYVGGGVQWSVLGQKGGRPGLKEELDMPGSQQVLSRPYETPRREGCRRAVQEAGRLASKGCFSLKELLPSLEER